MVRGRCVCASCGKILSFFMRYSCGVTCESGGGRNMSRVCRPRTGATSLRGMFESSMVSGRRKFALSDSCEGLMAARVFARRLESCGGVPLERGGSVVCSLPTFANRGFGG